MDVGSNNSYPAGALSNFSGHRFKVDGIECYSMEGFLQSLKFKSVEMQEHVCTLIGIAAKRKGSKKKWFRTQTLWWRGKEIDRHSENYQKLLDKAFKEMTKQSKSFQRALLASGDSNLTHSIGKSDANKTVLTEREFCRRLIFFREKLKSGEIPLLSD